MLLDHVREEFPPCRIFECFAHGGGREKAAKKLGEEAVETVIAAMQGERERIAAESADLLYHLLVVLSIAEVPLADVMAELERRTAQSGLAEKASRG